MQYTDSKHVHSSNSKLRIIDVILQYRERGIERDIPHRCAGMPGSPRGGKLSPYAGRSERRFRFFLIGSDASEATVLFADV